MFKSFGDLKFVREKEESKISSLVGISEQIPLEESIRKSVEDKLM